MIILIINIIAFNILNVDKENDIYAYEKEEIIKEEIKDIEVLKLDEVDIIETPIVYDNMTLEELSNKLERSLNSTISGYGDLIASY